MGVARFHFKASWRFKHPEISGCFGLMGTIGEKLGVLVRTAGKLVRRPASNVLLAVWEDI